MRIDWERVLAVIGLGFLVWCVLSIVMVAFWRVFIQRGRRPPS